MTSMGEGEEGGREKVLGALSVPREEGEEGWTPDPAAVRPVFLYNPFEEDSPIDPLQQQILIIKGSPLLFFLPRLSSLRFA